MRLRALLLAASLVFPAAGKAAGGHPRVAGYQLKKKRRPSPVELAALDVLIDRAGSGPQAKQGGRAVLVGAAWRGETAEALAARTRGYDGLELDLTQSAPAPAEAARLLAGLRRLLPAPKLIYVAVLPEAAALAAAVRDADQVVLLADAPLSRLERAVEALEKAGLPRAKVTLAVWLEGYSALAERLSVTEFDYSDKAYRWDAAVSAAFRGDRRYENEVSIRRKAEYARRAGLGGLAAWDVSGARREALPEPRRDLLIKALRRAADGEPESAPAPLKAGDAVLSDALSDGLDADAWVIEGGQARSRRRFAGAAVSAPSGTKGGACVLGARATARGRYCLALENGALVARKELALGSGIRLYDLTPRRLLAGAAGRRLTLSTRDLEDGRVRLEVSVDGEKLLEAVDDGAAGGAPLSGPGSLTVPAVATEGAVEAVLLESAEPAAARDAAPPVLADVQAVVTGGSTQIVWRTDEPADAQVEYGPTEDYVKATAPTQTPTLDHAVAVPDLEPGKTYHYRVLSRDAAGNVAVSADHTLTLAGESRYAPAASEPAPAPASAPEGVQTFKDDFNRPDGLMTNEYAYYNPSSPSAVKADAWEVTSGSMFIEGGAAWTGVPDGTAPNAGSTNATDSAVFRATTKRADFADVAVQFSLLNQGLTTSARTPAVAWDGCHVFLRYRSQYELYYASVNRRDNKVVIKKKVPGGPSNGGTYYDLSATRSYAVPYNGWQSIMATAQDNADGSVTISLYAEGSLLVQAVDDGSLGGAPLRGPGKVGIRGDNANLKWDDFTVTALAPEGGAPAPGGGGGSPAPGTGTGGATNVALGKMFTASSYAGLGAEPERANDADAVSRWMSEASDAQWLTADLGVAHEISGMMIRWGAGYARAYEVQVSQDGQTWALAHSQPAGRGGDELVAMAATTARYVRLNMTARASSEGYVVRELEIAGTPPAGADVAPPEISEIEVTGPASAQGTLTVSWKTNEPADGRVDFGPTALYGQSSPEQPDMVTKHVVTLEGLEPGKSYHYRIRSRDAFGNIGRSGDRVAAIGGSAGAGATDDAKAKARFLTPARADGYNDKAVFGPNAREVSIVDVRGKRVFRGRRAGGDIVWDCRDGSGRIVESGVYVARIVRGDSSVVFQSLAVVK